MKRRAGGGTFQCLMPMVTREQWIILEIFRARIFLFVGIDNLIFDACGLIWEASRFEVSIFNSRFFYPRKRSKFFHLNLI